MHLEVDQLSVFIDDLEIFVDLNSNGVNGVVNDILSRGEAFEDVGDWGIGGVVDEGIGRDQVCGVDSDDLCAIEYLNLFAVGAAVDTDATGHIKPRVLIPQPVLGELHYNIVIRAEISGGRQINLERRRFIHNSLPWIAHCQCSRHYGC